MSEEKISRCIHGVWSADHCYKCEAESAPPQLVTAQEKCESRSSAGYRCVLTPPHTGRPYSNVNELIEESEGGCFWQDPSPSPAATTQYCDSCGLPAHKDGVCQFSCPDPITTQPEPKPTPQIATTQGERVGEVQVVTVTWPDAVKSLKAIFDGLQATDRFHDQWDWMKAYFNLNVIKATIADLEERVPQPAPSPAATAQPKPAPRAEGLQNHLVKRMFDECGAEKANDFIRRIESGEHDVPSPWSAAQAPLLAKIAELELEVERLKRVEEFVGFTGRARAVLDRAKAAEARIAELESAQPKAEKVEKLVSDEDLQNLITSTFNTIKLLAIELLQRRQREERRGE